MSDAKVNPIERRSTNVRATATEKKAKSGEFYRAFLGTAIVYNEYSEIMWGSREIIEPRAAKRAVAECDVRANQNHDDNYVLGRTRSIPVGPDGESSLVLVEDDKGVHVTCYPADTTYARNLGELMARGEVDQMSFQFRVPPGGDHWDGTVDEPVRHIDEIFPLYDVAFVVYPAYPQTSASAETIVRSAGIDYDAVRRVYAKAKLGVPMTQAEAKFSVNFAQWASESTRSVRGCPGTCAKLSTSTGTWIVPAAEDIIGAVNKQEGLEGLDEARARELEFLRMQLECIRLSLRVF